MAIYINLYNKAISRHTAQSWASLLYSFSSPIQSNQIQKAFSYRSGSSSPHGKEAIWSTTTHKKSSFFFFILQQSRSKSREAASSPWRRKWKMYYWNLPIYVPRSILNFIISFIFIFSALINNFFPTTEEERLQRQRLRDLAVFERVNANPRQSSTALAVKKVFVSFTSLFSDFLVSLISLRTGFVF